MKQPRRLVRLLVSLLNAAGVPFGLGVAHAQGVAESIGERVVRFHADAQAREATPPSLALVRPMPASGPAPAGFRVQPTFAIARGGRVARVETERGTSLYGTGEVGGPLLRNGRVITCWNTDAYGYGNDSPSLYQSHPWVLAVRADGSAYGVLADTPGRIVVDLTHGIEFRAQGPPFPLIVIERDSPQDVVAALSELTGRMPLPPRWALGYQQCRYSYTPDHEVMRVAHEFRTRRIPCDVIWMDIDYMNAQRSFTHHPLDFPNSRALNDSLHALGMHSVWIVDPGLRQEAGYFPYDQGVRGDHFVKTGTGEDFVGRVWPGPCVFPDFTRGATRLWWAGLTRDFVADGSDGIWNDMNEPAVFETPNKSMPESNFHRADPELGGPGSHTRYHNVYGMLMARASREGLLEARPDRRPFVLSRANYLGGQRYAAAWTGDNVADETHLAMSVPMALNLGLSGQPFVGPDIGGFKGPGDPKLFARWMGVGALLPFARAHTEKGNPRKEPWSFGAAVEATCRRAIETRYRLMPYLYSRFRESATRGLPVVRPVFFADPKDPALRAEDRAFLIGADVLVEPPRSPNDARPIARPKGEWRELPALTGERDPDLPRLYQRAGSIVPIGPVVQYTGEQPLEDLTLLVSLDAHGAAEGELYEDAGDGFGFEKSEFLLTRWRAERAGGKLALHVLGVEGTWTPPMGRKVTLVAVE